MSFRFSFRARFFWGSLSFVPTKTTYRLLLKQNVPTCLFASQLMNKVKICPYASKLISYNWLIWIQLYRFQKQDEILQKVVITEFGNWFEMCTDWVSFWGCGSWTWLQSSRRVVLVLSGQGELALLQLLFLLNKEVWDDFNSLEVYSGPLSQKELWTVFPSLSVAIHLFNN